MRKCVDYTLNLMFVLSNRYKKVNYVEMCAYVCFYFEFNFVTILFILQFFKKIILIFADML